MSRPLTGLDSAFLAAETEAAHLHVTAVLTLEPAEDGPAHHADLRAHLAPRLRGMSVFRRHLREVPLGLDHPVWVEDDVDPDAHLRRVAVPPPGGEAELARLVSELAALPLDRSRPLWELWVVEGLARGRTALVAKVHHALIDGVAGAEILAGLLDLSPDAGSDPASGGAATERREPRPGSAAMLLRAARSLAGRPFGLARHSLQSAGAALRGLAAARRQPDGADGSAGLAAPDALAGAITSRREVAFASESLETLRELRSAFGVKLNDVVLAVCAGALRRYLAERGELPDAPLVAAVPVSLAGGSRHASGNRVSTLLTSLPVQLADPVSRLAHVRRSSLRAKRAHRAVGGELLASWAEVTPPALLSGVTDLYSRLDLADRHPPVVNLIVSNVPGPAQTLYCAGHRVEACHPLGPIYEGIGLNLTLLSLAGRAHFGLTACPDVVPDVGRIGRALGEATRELRAAAVRKVRETAPGQAFRKRALSMP